MSRAPKSSVLAAVVLALVAVLAVGGGVASAKTLRATMDGDQEVPKGDADGTGTARITTNRAKGRVCFRISLTNVGTVAAGHIHKGRAGEAGDIVVALFDAPTSTPRGCVRGVKRSVIRAIERNPGRYYVNVHNEAHPAGAVRGQLRAP
ncbi:MAG TPA: CHRD domain-containing protein [Solirubrobacteraceae bacterium]|nr:CHRD domain-containing protein [Solirubrobacteraceae bacterium]